MKRLDIIARAGRNLRQAKGRTILTSLAIGVGAFTITVALAAGAGGRAFIDDMVAVSGDTSSLQVFPHYEDQGSSMGGSSSSDGDLPEYSETTPQYDEESNTSVNSVLTQKDIDKIMRIDGIESVSPALSVSADYVVGPNGKKYIPSVEVRVDKTKLDIVAGSLTDGVIDKGSVIVPEGYVKTLGFTSAADAIGKTITIHVSQESLAETSAPVSKDMTFKIQAVDKKDKDAMDYTGSIRFSAADGKDIYQYENPADAASGYYGLVAQVKTGENIAKVQSAVESQGYQVYSLQDLREAMFTAVNVAMAGLAGFGGLAILASIFGIINTMYISVLERTQQIGLMKALGARRKDIGRLFRYEAAWIGFLGGAIGAGLAITLGLIANPILDHFLKLDGRPLLIFEPLSVAVVIVALILVAVVSGIFPSRKASKLDPVEALRVE